VLATGPKDCGFKHGRGDGILRAINTRKTPSFGWKIKPEDPCRNIYSMIKIPSGISDTDTQNSPSFFHLLAPNVSDGRSAREIWWTSQEFSPAFIIITMALHAHVSP
jgi:hypothetical protein